MSLCMSHGLRLIKCPSESKFFKRPEKKIKQFVKQEAEEETER